MSDFDDDVPTVVEREGPTAPSARSPDWIAGREVGRAEGRAAGWSEVLSALADALLDVGVESDSAATIVERIRARAALGA